MFQQLKKTVNWTMSVQIQLTDYETKLYTFGYSHECNLQGYQYHMNIQSISSSTVKGTYETMKHLYTCQGWGRGHMHTNINVPKLTSVISVKTLPHRNDRASNC